MQYYSNCSISIPCLCLSNQVPPCLKHTGLMHIKEVVEYHQASCKQAAMPTLNTNVPSCRQSTAELPTSCLTHSVTQWVGQLMRHLVCCKSMVQAKNKSNVYPALSTHRQISLQASSRNAASQALGALPYQLDKAIHTAMKALLELQNLFWVSLVVVRTA